MTLNLQAENRGGLLSGGELTVFLDGPGIEVGNLPNVPVAAAEGEQAGAARDGWPSPSLPASAVPGGLQAPCAPPAEPSGDEEQPLVGG